MINRVKILVINIISLLAFSMASHAMHVKTGADNIITINKNESWDTSLKLDLVNMGVATEQVENVINVVESFTAKVPEPIEAQGPHAEDVYRKAIANGKEGEDLQSFVNSEEFQRIIDLRSKVTADTDAKTMAGLLYQEVLYMANSYVAENCASGPSSSNAISVCGQLLSILKGNSNLDDLSPQDLGNLLNDYLGDALDVKSAEYTDEILGLFYNCAVSWLNEGSDDNDSLLRLQSQVRQAVTAQGKSFDDFVNNLSPVNNNLSYNPVTGNIILDLYDGKDTDTAKQELQNHIDALTNVIATEGKNLDKYELLYLEKQKASAENLLGWVNELEKGDIPKEEIYSQFAEHLQEDNTSQAQTMGEINSLVLGFVPVLGSIDACWNGEGCALSVATEFAGPLADVAKVIVKPIGKGGTYLVKVISKNGDEAVEVVSDAVRKGPYDSRQWRDYLDSEYGSDNVASTTVPPLNKPNMKLAGKEFTIDANRKVVFDNKGFPIFDQYTKYETIFTDIAFKNASSASQMRMATQELWEQIQKNPQLKNKFNVEQLAAIETGKTKIPGYAWHHHQGGGRMQLVEQEIHSAVKHIGGVAMWPGR